MKTLAHKVNATEEEDKTGDYDWSTPSTSRDGVTSNDYRGGGHKEYVTQKLLWSSFFVTLRPNSCHRVYETP